VDAPPGDVDGSLRARVVERFHDEHERLFGYCYRHDLAHAVEWVNLRVTGIGPIRSPRPEPLPAGHGDPARARVGERRVRFGESWHDASIYARDALRAGDALSGPAVVEEFGSTLPIAPGFTAHVDGLGHMVVARGGSG
jgi:N-methylhydantoinase A